MDCGYWKGIVSKLKIPNECEWAAHVLSTFADEEGSNLSEALKCLSGEKIIENTIFAYENWNAQPYCDEILLQFDKRMVAEIFKRIENPSENMKKGAMEFLDLYGEV